MNNLRSTLLPMMAILLTLLMGGCGKKFDEKVFSKQVCSELILPAHAELNAAVGQLKKATATFSRGRDEKSLLAVQVAWNRAMEAVQRCKVFYPLRDEYPGHLEKKLFSLRNVFFDDQRGNHAVLKASKFDGSPQEIHLMSQLTERMHGNWQQEQAQIAVDEPGKAKNLFDLLYANLEHLPAREDNADATSQATHARWLYHHLEGLYSVFNGGIDRKPSYRGLYDYLCSQGKAEQAAAISLQFKKTMLAFEVLRGSALQDRRDREAFYGEYEKLRQVLAS